jgi:hypothetical protein
MPFGSRNNPLNEVFWLSGTSKLPAYRLTVGAASSREINCCGWQPLSHSMLGVNFITRGVNFLAGSRYAILLHQKQWWQNDKDKAKFKTTDVS